MAQWKAELLAEGNGRFTCFAVAPLENAPPGDYEIRVSASASGKTVRETTGFTLLQ